VNRISLGVQSWNDLQLKRLGRIHDRQQAQQALDILNQFELTNVNIDLMYGLPQQTMAEALIDLETACCTGVPHISWYHLTLEPNTLFHHRPPKGLPSQDLVWEFELAGRDLLAKYGYHRYEVSAYSQLNRECQHNLNYWEFGDYLGIGAGAHSKLTDGNSGQVWRLMKHKHPQAYLLAKDEFSQTKTCVTSDDLPFEFMLNAMRLLKPIPFDLFEQRTGVSRITIMPILEQLAEDHLLTIENQQFELTALGYQFLDDVTAEFLKL
jgi:putative oxygen-independent coproporphyrinogen III oxidase